jgi:PAS domain-containing protein
MIAHDHPEVRGAEFVVFANDGRRYTDFTDAVCGLLGYLRKELLNKSIEDVSFKTNNVPQIFAQYVKQGAMEGDFVLQHKDGSAIPIHYRAVTCADGCHAAVWTPIKDWREPYLAALIETNPAKLARGDCDVGDRASAEQRECRRAAGIARRAVGAEGAITRCGTVGGSG